MIGLNHGMTGAVIALTLKNPLLAVPVSFVSHFLQDMVPHYDYSAGKNGENLFKRKFNIMLTVDFLLALGVMVILAIMFPSHKWIIWACMAAAASPDLMWAYYRLYGEHLKKGQPKYGRLAKLHIAIENEVSYGPFVEGLWFIVAAGIILALR
jgi:hypothetical protein